jgi:hypothetical protein
MSTREESTDRLMKDLRDLSFPRLIGSEGEKKIREEIKRRIQNIGYDFTTQPFDASLFRINQLSQIGNALLAFVFLMSAVLFYLHPLLFFVALGFIFILISKISSGSIEMFQPPNVPKFVKSYPTENIIVKIPAAEHSVKPREIIFMGHVDSKSSMLGSLTRVLVYLLQALSGLLVIILGILGIILFFIHRSVSAWNYTAMWVFCLIGMATGIILLFNVAGNKSPGASDNGTAVAILLELIRYYKANPIGIANLTFLFTSAEESGLTGAYVYAKELKDNPQIDKQNLFVINWDLAGLPGNVMVNTGVGIPKRLTSPTMSRLLDVIAKEADLPVKQAYLPVGGWTDALPFTHYGFEAITISGVTSKVHSAGDTPDIIDPANFYYSFVLGIELVKKLLDPNKS